MKKNFDKCLQLVLKDEGGYTNDPADSGGPTNFGITITDVRKYINKNATAQDVARLTVQQASVIYRERYWNPLGCDDLPSGVDYTVFDYGVNSGLGRARKALEATKGKPVLDVIDDINIERMTFLRNLAARRPKDQKFLKGWTNRVYRVQTVSKEMARTDHTASSTAGGVVAAGGVFATMHQFFQTHPYVSFGIALLAGAAIYFAIKAIRNVSHK